MFRRYFVSRLLPFPHILLFAGFAALCSSEPVQGAWILRKYEFLSLISMFLLVELIYLISVSFFNRREPVLETLLCGDVCVVMCV